jgi:hypothetical protein
MESVGFKEWAAVCEAMGQGRQSIILRKGGIAEGRDGFSFKYRSFFLFPTWFHEQPQKVRSDPLQSSLDNAERAALNAERRTQASGTVPEGEDLIEINYACQVEEVRTITSWDMAAALAPLHILREAVIRERFDYDEARGLHVAFVRVFRLEPRWSFANQKKYGGCRSWMTLPAFPNDIRLEPVLSEPEHQRLRKHFLGIVETARAL